MQTQSPRGSATPARAAGGDRAPVAGRDEKRAPAGDARFGAILRAAGMPAARGEPTLGRRTANEEVTAGASRVVGEPLPVVEKRDREQYGRDRSDGREDLGAFPAPPPALLPPIAQSAPPPLVAGSAAAHAEAAAMAEKLVTQLRVGRVGRDGHEVRMKLAIRGASGLDVRLTMHEGRLSAELVADAGMQGEARRIAEALRDELAARGFTLDVSLA